MNIDVKKIKQIEDLAINLGVVSVYDLDTYSLLELVYMIAEKVNEIIKEMLRFETDITNNLVAIITRLEKLLTEELASGIVDQLTKWLDDGTLGDIINNTLFQEINNRLSACENDIKILRNSLATFNIADFNHVDGDNITETIKLIMSIAEEGDIIYIPTGTYIINEPIELLSNMTLKGKSYRKSILKGVNSGCLTINGESILKPNTKGHKQGINVNNISLYVEDESFHIIQVSACSHITFQNVYLFGTTKSAVDCVEFFDIRWINCWFYWCGDYEGNYPVINFRNEEGYEYNNNHYFFGCMFESNRGQIIRIDAEHNTEFKFVSCKFENVESSVEHITLKNCGAVAFLDCMFSAQGRNNINFETMIAIENAWGITIQGTIYKWDDLNGGRTNYAIPKSLMNIVNSRSYKIDLVLFNNKVRLQSDNASYIQIWNPSKDGSYVNLIKHSGDSRKATDVPQTLRSDNNITVSNDYEPFLGINGLGTEWQFGRLVNHEDSTKLRVIHYDKQGQEHEVLNLQKNKINPLADIFVGKGLYLGRYTDSEPWGWGGCIFYDATNNQYKFYVDGQGWKVLQLV